MEILASGKKRGELALSLAVDGSLALCAIGLGLGLPGAAVTPWAAAAVALACGVRVPTALDKPYALLALAAALAAILSAPVLDPAMVGPLAALTLTGAVRDGRRAAGLGALFVAGVAARSVFGAHPGGAFLPGVALAWIAAAGIAGGIPRRAAIPAGAVAAALLFGLWRMGAPAPWWSLAAAIFTMGVLGRRFRRSAPALALAIGAGLVAGKPGLGPPATGTEAAVEALALLAVAWGICAVFAALRRGWKSPPGGLAQASILGAAGTLGAAVWEAIAGDFPDDPLVGAALALLVALGLAAAGAAARPSADESVGLPPERIVGPRSRKAAGGAALCLAGAALGGMAALGSVPRGAGLAGIGLLATLGILHLPLVPGLSVTSGVQRIAASLRGLVVFSGAAFLVARPLAGPMIPGSLEWWRSPAAIVTLFALGAAIAGAGHAIRRPGRIGPAPVAGALVCAIVLAFQGGLKYGLLPGELDVVPPDTAMATSVISMLFVAFSGPLGFGESELPGAARALGRLPAAAVAVGLAALAIAGLG